MGMFDRVFTRCPKCERRVECQSKSGPCQLLEYELEDAPVQVMVGILNGSGWTECEGCKTWLTIKAIGRPTYSVRADRLPGDEE